MEKRSDINTLRAAYCIDCVAHLLITSLIEMGRIARYRVNLRDVILAVATQNGELLMKHTASELFKLRLVSRSYSITKPHALSAAFWVQNVSQQSQVVHTVFSSPSAGVTTSAANAFQEQITTADTQHKVVSLLSQPVVVFVITRIPPFGLCAVRLYVMRSLDNVNRCLLVMPAPPQHEVVVSGEGSGAPNDQHLVNFIDCLAGEFVAQALLASDIPTQNIEHLGCSVRVRLRNNSDLIITPALAKREFTVEDTGTGSVHAVNSLSDVCKIASRYFLLAS